MFISLINRQNSPSIKKKTSSNLSDLLFKPTRKLTYKLEKVVQTVTVRIKLTFSLILLNFRLDHKRKPLEAKTRLEDASSQSVNNDKVNNSNSIEKEMENLQVISGSEVNTAVSKRESTVSSKLDDANGAKSSAGKASEEDRR